MDIEPRNTALEDDADAYLTSFLSWDVLFLFNSNEGGKRSASEIARALGRREREVFCVLDELARKGALQREFEDGVALFSLSKDKEMAKSEQTARILGRSSS